MINTRRGAMGFASTSASKAPTQPNFNLTRVVRGAKTCYDALQRVLNLVDMDDLLTKKSKHQQYGELCGGVTNDSNKRCR